MNLQELQHQLSLGEDSYRQFKADMRNADSLASDRTHYLDQVFEKRLVSENSTRFDHIVIEPKANRTSPTWILGLGSRASNPRGLGSGIKRALVEWDKIDFDSDESGNLFTATIHRKSSGKTKSTAKSTVKSTVKTPDLILALIVDKTSITVEEIAQNLDLSKSGVEKQLAKLKAAKKIRRIGPAKGGHWEVLEK